MTARYQTHCRTCFRLFKGDSEAEVIRKAEAHESARTCSRPVYDPRAGCYFLSPEDDLEQARRLR